jgi:hypothetical protein
MTTSLDANHTQRADADKTSVCPRCGARFTCGNVAGAATCWCASLPVLTSADKAATACYCPACLRELLDAEAASAAKATAADASAVSPTPTFGAD